MIGFGASFGFTVQGRIALAIGRALDIRARPCPGRAAQIHGPVVALVSVAVIVVGGMVLWELRRRRAGGTTAGRCMA